MSWIKTIGYKDANPGLKKIYDRVKGPDNTVDNVLTIHSLRPHTLIGHMTLYKSVLHNSNNTLPKWYLESIGVYVSYLNKCNYCIAHHFEGLKKLFNDAKKSEQFMEAVQSNTLNTYFDKKYYLGMQYSQMITQQVHKLTKDNIDELVTMGFSQGEILEINQVTSYFNYVNRMVLGLGVTTKGDILGRSPNENNEPSNWKHK